MEFMAAEAMVRNAQDVGSIARQIQEVFYADPSSVIPDVMAQAVEDKFDRGAEKTLQILVDSGKAKTGAFADKLLALCLRIVNAAPMSRAVALGLPGLVMSYWSRVDFVDDTRDSSMALFDLYRDPRDRLLAAAKGEIPIKWKSEEFGASALNRALVKRWARISLLGRAELFDEEWASALRDQVLTGKIKDDYVVLDYLASLGLATTSTNSRRGVRPALLLNVFGERVPGSAIRALFAAFAQSGDMKAHERKILQTFKAGLPSARPDVQPAEAIAISRMLRNASSRLSVYCDEHIESILGAEPAVRAILWWLLAMTFEISPDNPFLQAFGRTSSLFSRIAQIREEEQEYQFSSSYRPLSLEQLRKSRVKMASADEWPKGVGPWFELWTRGALALVKSDREDVLTKALSMKPDEFVSPVVRERWRDFVEDIQRDTSNLY